MNNEFLLPSTSLETSNEYWVKDLGEASFLLCRSQKLLRLQKENNFFWFVFVDKKTCQKLSNDYWFGEENLVPAKAYNDAIRTLKDRLFAQK